MTIMLANSLLCFGPSHVPIYWAQLQKIFSNDPDEDTDEVEVKYLRRKES